MLLFSVFLCILCIFIRTIFMLPFVYFHLHHLYAAFCVCYCIPSLCCILCILFYTIVILHFMCVISYHLYAAFHVCYFIPSLCCIVCYFIPALCCISCVLFHTIVILHFMCFISYHRYAALCVISYQRYAAFLEFYFMPLLCSISCMLLVTNPYFMYIFIAGSTSSLHFLHNHSEHTNLDEHDIRQKCFQEDNNMKMLKSTNISYFSSFLINVCRSFQSILALLFL